jgi:hypothetical protein
MRDLTDDRSSDGLSAEDLAGETAVDLPEREAMSTIGHGFGHGWPGDLEPATSTHIGNVAVPINTSEASNTNSTSSIAVSDAEQIVNLDQTTTVTGG